MSPHARRRAVRPLTLPRCVTSSLLLRWREAAIEHGAVLAHMRLAAGFRDRDHAVLPHEPGERDLYWARPTTGCDLLEGARARTLAQVERRIGHDRSPLRPQLAALRCASQSSE